MVAELLYPSIRRVGVPAAFCGRCGPAGFPLALGGSFERCLTISQEVMFPDADTEARLSVIVTHHGCGH